MESVNRYSPAFSEVASPLRHTASRHVVRSRTTPASTNRRPIAVGAVPLGTSTNCSTPANPLNGSFSRWN
jgi:hypothetical protein